MSRKLPDFLKSYLDFAKRNSESPLSYHLWGGISTVASALERKVWMQWGHDEIFPNQYIVLIGPSGCRKAQPLSISRSMIEKVGCRIIAEKITEQALIRRMKSALRQVELPQSDGTALMAHHCSISVISPELSVFLGQKDVQFLADLTDWYDSSPRWTYDTKHMETDEVVGVCVNLLGAMAPDWIPFVIPPAAIGGGFTSRVIFVVEHKKSKTIVDPNLIPVDYELRSVLEHDLEAIHKLRGEMTFSSAALKCYSEWYDTEEKKISMGRPPILDPRFAGYVSRRATHIKKIAMVLSTARSDSLVISESDFKRAVMLLERVETRMPETFGRVGKSIHADLTQQIMDLIRQRGVISRRDVMSRFYRDVDGRTIEIIEATMQATKYVKVEPDSHMGVAYRWIGD